MKTWNELENQIKQIAKDNNIKTILWGSGSPCYEPCIIATCKDSLSNNKEGFNVLLYSEGEGFYKPCKFYSLER
jgi:hypothetical protein